MQPYDHPEADAADAVVIFIELAGADAAERLRRLAERLEPLPHYRHARLLESLDQPLGLLVSDWDEVPDLERDGLELPPEARLWRFRGAPQATRGAPDDS